MAFGVTPTTGAGPYTFTADFADRTVFDHGYYVELRNTVPSDTSCPTITQGTNEIVAGSQALMQDGVYVRTVTVPDGLCNSYILQLFSPSGVRVDRKLVSVDNI